MALKSEIGMKSGLIHPDYFIFDHFILTFLSIFFVILE